METLIRIRGTGNLQREHVGGKAFYLDLLARLGMPVPTSLVIPAQQVPLREDLDGCIGEMVGTGAPWRLAIRSSSAEEDSTEESKAGHFLSLLGHFDEQDLWTAIGRVQRSGPDMAVLIQPLLNAKIAGVAFSCDPLTLERDRSTVVWTTGLADALVSGSVDGVQVRVDSSGEVTDGTWTESASALQYLVRSLQVMEGELGQPVDTEWVIDQSGQLWFVQCRPVVLPRVQRVSLDDESSFARLSPFVQQHHKIRLRRNSLIRNVPMAPAIVETWTIAGAERALPMPDAISASAGVSVVLLQPERVRDQVVRDFAAVHGTDVDFFARGCRRYAVRRYPGSKDVESALASVLSTGLDVAWASTGIAQAVWAATATGIAKRIGKEYVVDIALGHFVPKGVVPTTTAILSEAKEVVTVTHREQPTAYHFIDGHVVTETPPTQQLRSNGDLFRLIIDTLAPLFDVYPSAALEFGVMDKSGHRMVYLIDLAESDSESANLDSGLVASGVLSVGKCAGRVHFVELAAVGNLDRHLHDRVTNAQLGDEAYVVFADRSSVELLPLVGAPGVVGFVFRQGSVLSHLAVVLREKGIPAVTTDDSDLWEKVRDGVMVSLDAVTGVLASKHRVQALGACE